MNTKKIEMEGYLIMHQEYGDGCKEHYFDVESHTAELDSKGRYICLANLLAEELDPDETPFVKITLELIERPEKQ